MRGFGFNSEMTLFNYLYAVEQITPDSKILIAIVQTRIPFGKYKGTLICDLPVYYLEWLHNKGFPAGNMGMMLATTFEIKTNGLNTILMKVKAAVATGQYSK